MAGVQRVTLNNLQPEIKNSLIVGIIINKQEMRTFQAKTTSFTPGERAVWNFTIRDSDVDFANVTVWGSKEYVERLCVSFKIGQVVELINPRVIMRRGDDRGELFVPSVSCQCNITLNQGTSDMHIHNAPDRVQFTSLLSLPTKNPNKVTSLAVALKNIEQLKDRHIDVMVTLMSMSSMNHITTKDGRAVVCRDIDVNDGSVDKPTSFRLWGTDWAEKAEFWQPRHTVLFLADVLITFSTFKKQTLMTIGRKTLITENPNIPQTQIVRAAVRHLPDQPLSTEPSTPDLNSILNTMTIREICERVEKGKSNPDNVPFTTLAHVVINQMNFEDKSVVVDRCAMCKKWIDSDKESCTNPNCACGNGGPTPLILSNFNLKLNVSDYSGHLVACRLVGTAAEEFLKCSVKDFKAMSTKEREELKWRCLLEKCVIALQVVGPTPPRTSPIYNVLSVKRELENERMTDYSKNSGLYS